MQLFFFQITQKITNFMLKSIITTNILMLVSKIRLFKTLPKTRPSNGYFTLCLKRKNRKKKKKKWCLTGKLVIKIFFSKNQKKLDVNT